MKNRKLKIAVTGGPCAGKTALINVLSMHFHKQLTPVEEAGSFLFHSSFKRRHDDAGLRSQQRLIYHIQREFEELAEIDASTMGILCDRGALDSLAYWPGTEREFFNSIHSSLNEELHRYDWVIHIDSAPPVDLGINGIRTETVEEILALNEKIKSVWKNHPRRIVLPNDLDFEGKAKVAVSVVERMIKEREQAQALGSNFKLLESFF